MNSAQGGEFCPSEAEFDLRDLPCWADHGRPQLGEMNRHGSSCGSVDTGAVEKAVIARLHGRVDAVEDLEGRRQMLAVDLANRERHSSWKDFLAKLKQRHLHGWNSSSRTIMPD